jgi:hypothetical protein
MLSRRFGLEGTRKDLPFALAFALAVLLVVLRVEAQAPPRGGAGQPGASGADDAAAQAATLPPGSSLIGPGGTANLLLVLMAPSVQKELKLTDDQQRRLVELAKDAGERSAGVLQSMLLQPPARFNPQAMLMTAARMRQEDEDNIARVLDAGQKERFHQIALRAEGAFGVARPEVARALRLTQSQIQQLHATLVQWQQAQRQMIVAVRSAGPLDNDKVRHIDQQSAQLRDAASRQLSRILSSKQVAAFNKMLGEPFDVSEADPDGGPQPAGTGSATKASSKNGPADTPDEKPRPRTRRKTNSGRPND